MKKALPPPQTGGFGALAGALAARGFAVSADPVALPPNAPDDDALDRLVVRRETKGRGGKTVTTVHGVPTGRAEAIVRQLKTRLGTGASVDGDVVVVQGALVDRVADLLVEMGASKVVRGN